MEERFWNKVNKDTSNGCWEWTACLNPTGYGKFSIYPSWSLAHRVAFELYYKRPIEEGKHLLHSCDNPKCVNPSHLSEGTNLDNVNDKIQKGRHHHKLTTEQVQEIRNKYSTGQYTYTKLAGEYDVAFQTIGKLIKCERRTKF